MTHCFGSFRHDTAASSSTADSIVTLEGFILGGAPVRRAGARQQGARTVAGEVEALFQFLLKDKVFNVSCTVPDDSWVNKQEEL